MKPEDQKRWFSRQSRGQVMVMFAMFLTVLISFIALSLDVGNILAERRGVQNAVDAAAMAAGRLILLEETDDLETHAQSYVDINGYDGGEAQVSFPHDGKDTEVAVEFTSDVPGFFLSVFYDGPWSVSARAVAAVIHEVKEVSLLALGENPGSCTGNPGNSTGVHFGGNALINIAASVLSNGCIVFNGNATEGSIDGTVEAHSHVQDIPNDLYVDEDGILTSQPIIEDPFADLSPNPPPSCSSPELNPDDYKDPDDSNHWILEPGRYPGFNGTNISLKAGEYCFTGKLQVGGFLKSFDDDNGNGKPDPGEYHHEKGEDVGAGVLLHFASNAELHMTSNQEGIAVKSMGAAWDDVVIWYTNCGNNKDLKLAGNDNMWIIGVVYAPCSTVELTGNSSSEVPIGAIVANQIKVGGTPTLNFNSSITIEIEPPRVYLVE